MVLIVEALPLPDGYPDPTDDQTTRAMEIIEALADQERNDLLTLTTALFNASPEERAHHATRLFDKIEEVKGYAPTTDEHKEWIIEKLEGMAVLRAVHVKEHAERAALSWITQASTALSRYQPAVPAPSLADLDASLPPLQLQRLDGTTTAIPLPDITDEEFQQVMQEFPLGWTERDAERQRADEWIEKHSVDLTPEEWTTAWVAARAASRTTHTSSSPVAAIFAIIREAWRQFGYLPYNGLDLRRPTEKVPHWVLEAYLLVTPLQKPPRPIITPAFKYDGREGLGRISSSQISLALFTACVAPKSEWDTTTKGFPRYVFAVPSGEIVIILKPDVVVRGDVTDQVTAMNKVRDELSVNDWDLLTILMEQVFAEGRSDASAFITSDAALDYRQLKQKRKGKYNTGHRDDPRARVDACLNRVAHLHVRTDTLHILEDTGKGKPRKVLFDCDEKVLKIKGDITKRDNDTPMGWAYEFGKTFVTFLHRPNNYVGYLLQGTVALDGRKEAAKQLAHYLTIHTRIDAHNGRGMERFMGQLVGGAKLPYNAKRPQRTITDAEDALREVVKAGLYRFEHDGRIFDADSADLSVWTAIPKDAKGYGLLKLWEKQKVVIRAEPDIEERYDRYRRPPLRPIGG